MSSDMSIWEASIWGVNMQEWDGAPPQHPDMDVAIAAPTAQATATICAPRSDSRSGSHARKRDFDRPIFDVMRWISPDRAPLVDLTIRILLSVDQLDASWVVEVNCISRATDAYSTGRG